MRVFKHMKGRLTNSFFSNTGQKDKNGAFSTVHPVQNFAIRSEPALFIAGMQMQKLCLSAKKDSSLI